MRTTAGRHAGPSPGRHRRGDGRVRAAVFLVVVTIAAAMLWNNSMAAFVKTTTNPGDSWSSGNLALTATNGSGTSMTATAAFTMTGMVPSTTTYDKCITVVYSGSITAGGALRLYSASTSNSAAVNAHSLASYISLQIDEGTGATDVNCTGFASTSVIFDTTHRSGATSASVIAGSLMDFTTNQTSYATGTTTGWTPAASPPTTSRSYRFRIYFPGSATFPGGGSNTIDTDLMNMTSQTTFTWEVQS